jgi:hypothetical protein
MLYIPRLFDIRNTGAPDSTTSQYLHVATYACVRGGYPQGEGASFKRQPRRRRIYTPLGGSLLEYYLYRLHPHTPGKSKTLAAGMSVSDTLAAGLIVPTP